MMEPYLGYSGTLELDQDEGIFHGRVIGIADTVTYEGKSPSALVKAFHESIDDYVAFCKERGEEPDKPWSGKFVVRISPELHLLAAEAAGKADQSLNAWVKSAIESAIVGPTGLPPLIVPLPNTAGVKGAADQSKAKYTQRIDKAKRKAKSIGTSTARQK